MRNIGSQLRSVVSVTNGGLFDKNNGTKTKKLAHEYEPIFSNGNHANSFQMPIDTSQNQTVWIAALAFILGINIGGAYIVYNSKIKKTLTKKKSGRSKKRKFGFFFFFVFRVHIFFFVQFLFH